MPPLPQYLLLLFPYFLPYSNAQFPALANEIFGPLSIPNGISNIMGSVVAADDVHSKCIQKTLCDEFSQEVVNMTEMVDHVKRTVVMVPVVVQPRGRLRWIGDAVTGAISKVLTPLANKLGISESSLRKRQGGVPLTFAARMAQFALANWQKIPVNQMFHLMDTAVDMTNVMERKGSVYPFFKSSALGYGFGHMKNDTDVCHQVAPSCGDWWSHVEKINEYEGGGMTRKIQRTYSPKNVRSGEVDGSDPLVWNNMRIDQLLNPKVFLCKSGQFIEHFVENMGGKPGDIVKTRFGPEEFGTACDPKYLDTDLANAHGAVSEAADAGGGGGGGSSTVDVAAPELDASEIEIIDARKGSKEKDGHSKDSHATDSKDSHTKDAHASDSHSKDSHAKDSHSKDSHAKDSHTKDSHSKDSHAKDSHGGHERRSDTANETETLSADFDGLPILVFEGLPDPSADQTEEELVESVLKSVNLPRTAVRTALRLPVNARGRSLVLVEMETEEEGEEVLENREEVRKTSEAMVKVGIRRARYKELWKFVRALTSVKEVVHEKVFGGNVTETGETFLEFEDENGTAVAHDGKKSDSEQRPK